MGVAAPTAVAPPTLSPAVRLLIDAVQALSLARDRETVQAIVRRAARQLTGADGATFVLRDGDQCFYADEDAIEPLWKGQRFPMRACVSGWAMLHRSAVVIPDIYVDDRVPHDAYRPTFVKSMAMIPIRTPAPIGAIGIYWANHTRPTDEQLEALTALADSVSIALEHVELLARLEERVDQRTAELAERTREAETLAGRLRAEVAERARAEAEVRRLSLTDPLTGLDNRRGFLEHAEEARARWALEGVPALLLFVDLDGLKAVNDERGHDEGDELIRAAATLLREVLGDDAVVGRWGGDELVALVSLSATPADIVECLELAAAVARAEASPGLSFSVGTCAVDAGDLRPTEELLGRADVAMYREKEAKRLRARVAPR